VFNLVQQTLQQIVSQAPQYALTYGSKVLLAIAVYYIGTTLASWLSKATVSSFTTQIIYYGMFTMVVVAALGQLGVQTASFVAIIGAAGLAIGLAVQGSLANFASGVLLILLRPFKAGDYIEAGGVAGCVEAISIVSTRLLSGDNRTIMVPNGAIMNGNIVNYSTQAHRRVDMIIGVSYKSDLNLVRNELTALITADERVLKDKELTIGVLELADSSIKFAVRPWVKSADYWPVHFDFMENVKKRFDAVGIEIPTPQVNVQLAK
jgi:small conductance mechanosensitive channel